MVISYIKVLYGVGQYVSCQFSGKMFCCRVRESPMYQVILIWNLKIYSLLTKQHYDQHLWEIIFF